MTFRWSSGKEDVTFVYAYVVLVARPRTHSESLNTTDDVIQS